MYSGICLPQLLRHQWIISTHMKLTSTSQKVSRRLGPPPPSDLLNFKSRNCRLKQFFKKCRGIEKITFLKKSRRVSPRASESTMRRRWQKDNAGRENRDGATMRRRVKSRCAGGWISTGLPCVNTHISQHVYSIPTCA